MSRSKSNDHENEPEEAPVFLSLGSNVGERMEYLRRAVESMKESDDMTVQGESAVYETEPVEVEDQDRFLNMVARISTELEPKELLECLKEIEQDLGRKHRRDKGPREIDIDILFYGHRTVDSADLKIPHERLQDRKFVLFPLSQLAPDFMSPTHKKSVAELLHDCQDKSYIHLHGHLTYV
ncbi:MAG: 2-amino-4-hydroxy-6-hydroxymethyldihydropteridine diphosphokinase [Candidatus Marinimicrobia bacterium]|nr:2-amino-4-hydroxy-6-hydroxymethyldihydropteridine diphosphokinase [Candidatus Neomarinimicrobiota bacterium]MCF7829944.1 2-amino-4-hydroxy-6-hydroxymethyldihydropteridine diphosphokinase [Candidatus Neomarinimicrobiota bacterium]MCF7881902.1 2-amino-4-hydroxy-6-hydroxymethyldihydropteridine diphosphokinase [Candidatus Neomarinimicrobiota bacterium]